MDPGGVSGYTSNMTYKCLDIQVIGLTSVCIYSSCDFQVSGYTSVRIYKCLEMVALKSVLILMF